MKTEPSQGPYSYTDPQQRPFSGHWVSYILDTEGSIIAEVGAEDKTVSETNARFLAASWEMREDFVELEYHLTDPAELNMCRQLVKSRLRSLGSVSGYSDTPEAPKTPTIDPQELLALLEECESFLVSHNASSQNPYRELLAKIRSLTNKEPLSS